MRARGAPGTRGRARRPRSRPRAVPGRPRPSAAAVRRLDGSEHRRERRERVLGHLRLRVRDPPQERGLARVREAQRAPRRPAASDGARTSPPPRPARLGDARRLLGRRREAPVADAAPARRGRARPCAPGCARSATSRPSSSNTCVPTGTAQHRRPRRRPRCLFAPFAVPTARRRGSASCARRTRGRAGRDRRRAPRRRRCRRRRRRARPWARTSRGGS